MNFKATIIAIALGCFAASGLAIADADDEKWINQCIKDNKKEGQTPEVVKAYCECMNNRVVSSV